MEDRLPTLVAAHPAVFRGENPGQVLPAGWYKLVDQLVTELEQILGDEIAKLKVHQIKAKFASLRFYYSLGVPEPLGDPRPATVTRHAGGYVVAAQSRHPLVQAVDAAIAAATEASERTCMECGEPSELMLDGAYVYTACRKHRRRGSITLAEYERRQAACKGKWKGPK
jgi:hypothetical protein